MANYLLSVDGGGTKTEFCISDGQGNILESIIVGCSNYKSVGKTSVFKSLAQGLDILEQKGMKRTDILYSVWGISGCDSEQDFTVIDGILDELGIELSKRYLCNDGILAFYAQAFAPGIVIISGTGSIALGIGPDGRYERVGGWGYNISDIGSGYWIGAEALKRTLLYCDGCGDAAGLTKLVKEYFQCKNEKKLPYIVTGVTDFYEIAKVAQVVVEAAVAGEEEAMNILREGAEMLASLIRSIYQRMGFHEGMSFSIVFSGGVMKSELYQKLVKEALSQRISLEGVEFCIQKNTPVYGGIRLARKILNEEIMK